MEWLALGCVGTAVVLADQFSKREVLARQGVRDTSAPRRFFAIHCILNRRAAVVPLRARASLVGLWILCAGLALWSLGAGPLVHNTTAATGIGFALGGVTGNLIDRLQRGGIVDFIAIRPWIFNLADTAVVAGLALTFWSLA